MDEFVLHNGTFFNKEANYLNAKNRGFLYGDGLFESIRLVNGIPLFVSDHFKRLKKGAETLKIQLPSNFSEAWLIESITALARKNMITKGGRARLTVYRDFGGLYSPLQNTSSYVLEVEPLVNNKFVLNQEGLDVELFQDIHKVKNQLSSIKTLNGLHYIQAALFCKEKKIDNCLLINERDQILEAYNGNLFVVSNGALYTPGLEMGVLAGVMRMHIINVAIKNGLKVYECGLMPQNLLASDEIFITNSIKGLMWVSCYRSKRYFNNISKKLVEFLNKEVEEAYSISKFV
jgi:branched-subunit amino acid aminotransferase/4-amino-4-deoxychorismate lyase